MKTNFPKITGWILFSILLIIFAIHIYWGAGGLWPGDSPETLAKTVIGQPGVALPLGFETYSVATVFMLFALLAITPFTSLKKLMPEKIFQILFYVVALIFLLRGIWGYTEQWLMPSEEGVPFIFWNRILYSPLCLLMSTGYIYIVRSVYKKD